MIFEYPTIDIITKELELKDKSFNQNNLNEIFSYQKSKKLKDSCICLEKSDLQFSFKGNDLWGLDLPVRISNGNFNKTIVFLGQDPLRKSEDYPKIKNKIVVSLPFAVNCEQKFKKEIQYLIEYICDRGDSIYFTDIFKIYTGENLNTKKYKDIKNINVSIIKKELDMIKPDIIIASGKVAQEFIKNENINNCKIIEIPHYTAAACNTKKSFEELPGFNKKANEKFNIKKFEYLKNLIENNI